MNFFYLHGFNSVYKPDDPKIKVLETIGEVRGLSYDSFGDYKSIEHFFNHNITLDDDSVLVGTCLGGYWAGILGEKFQCPVIMINPLVDPSKDLRVFLDINLQNPNNTAINSITSYVLRTYEGRSVADACRNHKHNPLILKGCSDAIVSKSQTENTFDFLDIKCYNMINHQFSDLEIAKKEIMEYVSEFYS